jgi:hypothetical protein
MLGNARKILASEFTLGGQLGEVLTVNIGEPQAMCAGDDQVEYRAAPAEAARLSRKAADHLRPAPHLLKRPLQEIRRAEPLQQAW